MIATLFDPGPPDPIDDAAPRLGSSGASVRNLAPKCTRFGLAPVRRSAPETSHDAARRIEGIAGALCQRVLAYIRDRQAEGATDAECQEALNMLTQTQTPRRNALAKLGAVVNSGKKRPTPSGRNAIVWVAPEYAPRTEGGTR